MPTNVHKRVVLTIMVTMSILISMANGQSEGGQAAEVPDIVRCVGECALGGCLLAKDKSACALKCLGKCGIKSAESDCHYQCAVDKCTKLGDDLKKVVDCVESCVTTKC